jgi:hypothetical protein
MPEEAERRPDRLEPSPGYPPVLAVGGVGDGADERRAAGPGRARRVQVVRGGPILIEGPVEITLADGMSVRSDRFVVALCACHRSQRYPLCDTSHRRHPRHGS